MQAVNLSIIIVNYATPQLCNDCLGSIYSNHPNSIDKTLVVDNKSPDNSIDLISDYLNRNNLNDSVGLITSDKNAGFSSGNNIGIKASSSGFVLLLNSDTVVRPGAIELLVKTLQDNPQMGMASPRLEWTDGTPQESCFRFHRPINELIRSAATGPITRLFKRYEVPLRVSGKVL